MKAQDTLRADVRLAIGQLLDYLYDDEKAHFEGCNPEGRKGHIFRSLHCLREWLEEVDNLDPQNPPGS